jgi:anti-sigma factor RsiW
MWCRNVRGQLSAYADGELTPAMTQQVRQHLAGCACCTQELASLKRLSTLTSAIPFEEVSTALQQRILTSLHQAKFSPEPAPARAARYPFPPMTWAWAAFATAAVAVACGSLSRLGHVPAASVEVPLAVSTPVPSRGAADEQREAAEPARPAPVVASDRTVPAPKVATPVAETPAAPVLAAELDSTALEEKELAPVVSAKPSEKRVAVVMPPAPATAERPQPAAVTPGGKLATEPKGSEPGVTAPSPMMARENVMAMPGDPVVNSTAVPALPDPVVSPEKEPATRMAGMAIETESPGEEDEGLRSFRMFLQENSRNIPQPPAATPGRERRGRKSL